ncbi:hypothetical protein [Paenibacillus luteus]|nr:hypothetical protein [Paenibacillus luteus]
MISILKAVVFEPTAASDRPTANMDVVFLETNAVPAMHVVM